MTDQASKDVLVIGTRGSALALWQAHRVQALLGGPSAVRIEVIQTSGDRLREIKISEQLDKGFFTKELEDALLGGRVDLAVHSLKDLPTQLPDGLGLAAVPERAPAGDLLLVRPDALDTSRPLPIRANAPVGTSSMRRVAQLGLRLPDATTGLFRGNVETRLAKCVRGEVDAVLLARAGISRLGLDVSPLIPFDLDPWQWLPAAAQGALGIEIRSGDARTAAAVATLHDADTAALCKAERGVLAILEGGCHVAYGARAEFRDCDAIRCIRLRIGAESDAGVWKVIEVCEPADAVIEVAWQALQAAWSGARPTAEIEEIETCWSPALPWS